MMPNSKQIIIKVFENAILITCTCISIFIFFYFYNASVRGEFNLGNFIKPL